jgi:hypothetical protein
MRQYQYDVAFPSVGPKVIVLDGWLLLACVSVRTFGDGKEHAELLFRTLLHSTRQC